MKTLALVMVLSMIASTGYAKEERYIGFLKRDVTTIKKGIIAKVMNLTEGEATVFWPVYKDYQLEMDKLNDSRLELLQEYKVIRRSISEEMAEVMVTQSFDLAERDLQLKRKYHKKFNEVIFPSRVARFFRIEHQVGLMVQLQIASKLRLIR